MRAASTSSKLLLQLLGVEGIDLGVDSGDLGLQIGDERIVIESLSFEAADNGLGAIG